MLCFYVGDRSEFGIVSKIDDNGLLNINCYNEDNEYDTIYCNSVGPIISKNPFVHMVSLDDAFRGEIIEVDEEAGNTFINIVKGSLRNGDKVVTNTSTGTIREMATTNTEPYTLSKREAVSAPKQVVVKGIVAPNVGDHVIILPRISYPNIIPNVANFQLDYTTINTSVMEFLLDYGYNNEKKELSNVKQMKLLMMVMMVIL